MYVYTYIHTYQNFYIRLYSLNISIKGYINIPLSGCIVYIFIYTYYIYVFGYIRAVT